MADTGKQIAWGWRYIRDRYGSHGELTDEQARDIRERFRSASHGPAKIIGLPWHVRLRLAVVRRIDRLCIRLVERDHYKAAIALWRVTGLWR